MIYTCDMCNKCNTEQCPVVKKEYEKLCASAGLLESITTNPPHPLYVPAQVTIKCNYFEERNPVILDHCVLYNDRDRYNADKNSISAMYTNPLNQLRGDKLRVMIILGNIQLSGYPNTYTIQADDIYRADIRNICLYRTYDLDNLSEFETALKHILKYAVYEDHIELHVFDSYGNILTPSNPVWRRIYDLFLTATVAHASYKTAKDTASEYIDAVNAHIF